MEKLMEQMRKQGQMPEDVGLLPGTFIMPTGKNLPSWTSQTKDRWQLEKKRAKSRLFELGLRGYWKYWHIRPRPNLQLNQIPSAAENLHKTMYKHFADGNLGPIESILLPGMLSSLRGRIGQRPPGTRLKWTLHKYLSRSTRVSWKAGAPSMNKDEKKTERHGVIQAVVRIHSLQSLQHVRRKKQGSETKDVVVDAQGREIHGTENIEKEALKHAKELVEYVVIQKTMKKSREGPWKVQGTTEETTLERMQRAQRKPRESEIEGSRAETESATIT